MEKILEAAKKFLRENRPKDALKILTKFLHEENFSDEWKIHELIGASFHDLADAEGAAQAYRNAAATDKILRSQRAHFSNYLFALHYLPQVDEKILFETAKIYDSLYRDTEKFPTKKFSHEKIHVAFIAPHFLDSSSARFYENLLTDYEREKFFVTAWSLSSREDNFTKKIRYNVDKFFDISEISFEEVAQKIFVEGVDVLFDLGGHTDGGETLQILSYKPAPIQISGIAYFDTTGLGAIDYFLTDDFLIEHSRENFTEKILTLESAFAFQPNENMIRAKKFLSPMPHENFVFGSLNNFMKITDEYLNAAKKILELVPNSKIIFRDTTPLESRKKSLEEKILSAGIKNFEVRRGEDNFFDDYAEIDLILDTFPYSGGLMTALALYFGVPVLNLCGKNHCNRIGAEMLHLVGLEEFIVKNLDDYIKKAVDFANSKTEKNIRLEKLLDTKSFVKNFYDKILELINFA